MATNNRMTLLGWDVVVLCWILFSCSPAWEEDGWNERKGSAPPPKKKEIERVRMRGVIEHNRNTGPRSAGRTLAGTKPPILCWQAANGGPLAHRMLMPNFRAPGDWPPLPKHKERRVARVHAWQPPFTPTSAGDNKRINHRRLLQSFFLTPLLLSICVLTASNACCS